MNNKSLDKIFFFVLVLMILSYDLIAYATGYLEYFSGLEKSEQNTIALINVILQVIALWFFYIRGYGDSKE